MKILSVQFRNLNSLEGNWKIDFKASEYLENGIFAIVGPTGAGKTTILDAICLALYGKTPRLPSISKKDNEVMSRHTAECSAEVLFENQNESYLCHWSQRRARNKADGPLQPPKYEVSDYQTRHVLKTGQREVSAFVEEKTGMNFSQFTRSMLLAQGGFDAFLKAKSDDRSLLLEQITGTSIYSKISVAVHERYVAEKNILAGMDKEIAAIGLLTTEELEAMQKDLLMRKQEAEEGERQCKDVEQAISWLNGMNNLRKEIASAEEARRQAEACIQQFEPEQIQLKLAQSAAAFDGIYAELVGQRQGLKAEQQALETSNANKPDYEAALQQKEKHLTQCEQALELAKQDQKKELVDISKVRPLDARIADKKKILDSACTELKQAQAQIKKTEIAQQKNQRALEQSQADIIPAQEYQKSHAEDEKLISQLAGIEVRIVNCQSLAGAKLITEKNYKKIESDLRNDTIKSTAANEAVLTYKEKLESVRKDLDCKKRERSSLLGGRDLAEVQREKEWLLERKAQIQKVVSFEKERAHLEDGKPCPLCGATEHPYAKGNVPVLDETEKKIREHSALIAQVQNLDKIIEEHATHERKVSDAFTKAERDAALASQSKQSGELSLHEKKLELVQAQSKWQAAKASVWESVSPYKVGEELLENMEELLRLLKVRLSKWQKVQQQIEQAQQTIAQSKAKHQELDSVLKMQRLDGEKKQTALDLASQEHQTLVAERQAVFGEKDPDAEETRLEKTVVDAEKILKQVQCERDKTKEQYQALLERIKVSQDKISNLTPALQSKEVAFLQSIAEAGFSDETSFCKQRLIPAEREKLQQQAKALYTKRTEVVAQKKSKEEILERELAKHCTDSSLEELQPLLAEVKAKRDAAKESIGALQQKLKSNQEAANRSQEKQKTRDEQKAICNKWGKLHDLIGSHDGSKFRIFVQGITLDGILFYANKQLRKMTDRYKLMQVLENPLELNVRDAWQGGEIRSVKNLSGGESFIVSLALALGLSKMSSRRVRVDSFFLDEGFGTLDEEALETALGALSSLNQQGKLIGIISHVLALKERISTQITVQRADAGRSTLSGPGVSGPGVEKVSGA